MRCPRCKGKYDILRYVPMGQAKEFFSETNPIYKCPECRWIFSPALTLDERLREALELIRHHAPELLAEDSTHRSV